MTVLKFSKDNFGIASCRIVQNLFLQYDMNMEALKLASGFADCCDKCCKTFSAFVPHLPKCSITRGTHLDTYPPETNSSNYFFHFLFFSCRSSMTIFIASPLTNNVPTPQMSQGHIKIQICPVFGSNRQTDKQTDRQTDRQAGRKLDRQTDIQANKQTDVNS